jgi:hypothetical protein
MDLLRGCCRCIKHNNTVSKMAMPPQEQQHRPQNNRPALTMPWPHQEQWTRLEDHAPDLKDNSAALRTRALTSRPHCRLKDCAPNLKVMCSPCARHLGLKDNDAASRTRALALRLCRCRGDHAFNIKTMCLPCTRHIHLKDKSFYLKSTFLTSAVPLQQQQLQGNTSNFEAIWLPRQQQHCFSGNTPSLKTTWPPQN